MAIVPSKKMIAICQYGGDFDTNDDGTMNYLGGEAYAVDLDENMQLSGFKQEIAETIDSTVDGMIIKYFLPGNKKNLITVSKDKDFQRMVNYYKEADQLEVFITKEAPPGKNAKKKQPARRSCAELYRGLFDSIDVECKGSLSMDHDAHRFVSLRASRRPDRLNNNLDTKGANGDDGFFDAEKSSSDYPFKIIWKRGFIRLLLVGGILWMLLILVVLLFHIWTCQSSLVFLSAICNKESTVFHMLHTMGLVTSPHRCNIPLANDPEKVIIPEKRSPSKFVQSLSYFEEDSAKTNGSESPLFGGHQSWEQRDESFRLKSSMKVHCGFMRNSGAEMSGKDMEYVKRCKFVVASGIFDGYDTPHQPSNISPRSKKLFCFLMVVDEVSLNFIKTNVSVREEGDRGQWVGIWRLILLKNPPYDEPRRNGKVPKILTHRLFPQALYSIWIDGKMELIVDPLLMLERYLWRGKHTFAIAQHKHHKNIYEEADSNKRRKRYARPLIDLHMKIYRYEGLEPWSPLKQSKSDVPEGAIIIREHTPLNNLFSCLWFNEVNLFTPRDQLSFGFVVYRLKGKFKLFMFPNCEYNSIFILHPHTREHSSKIEWVKSLNEFKGNNSGLKETRGGLGLWSPYPADLSLVVLPPVARTSKAG